MFEIDCDGAYKLYAKYVLSKTKIVELTVYTN